MRIEERLIKTVARLPLRARRHALAAFWKASAPVRKDPGFELEPVLRRALRVGSGPGRRIARELEFHDVLQKMEWYAGTIMSREQALSDFRRVQVPEHELLSRIAETGEPVVLAPIHMGIFPFALTVLLWRYFAGRRVLILRARDDLEENNIGMERIAEIASEMRILNTRDESAFLEAMRFARKGGVVISLIDLPPDYGSPARTQLFGEPASIALGLDAMARMLKAVVVPLAVVSSLRGETVALGQPFEVIDTSAEARAELALHLGRQIERFVALSPAQWHMWARLSEFRSGLAPAPGAAPTDASARTKEGAAHALA